MGHREARRVPMDFDWPLGEVWEGYLSPDRLDEDKCPDCERGYSPHGEYLHALWYGNGIWDPARGSLPFHPERYGSVLLRPDTPAVRAFAERNVERAPEFYGTSESAIVQEASRLARLWNGMWCHHLNQDDVNALVGGGRLMDFTHTWSREDGWQPKDPPFTPTAAQVNEWSLSSLGHDSINAMIAVRARCEREGFPVECPTCAGHGSTEKYPGQRAEAEAWERTDPPSGGGWQLWETVTEGSPKSPVFASAEALADWCETNATVFADQRWSRAQWLESFLTDTTDVGSLMVMDSAGFHPLGPGL